MKSFLKIAPLLLALVVPALAAEPADSMRTIGAQIKEKDGEILEITFKDCSKLGEAEFRLIGQCLKLKSITLYGGCAGLNDQTAPLLANLSELENLGTDGLKLSDNGFTSLAALKNLRSLSMFHPSWNLPTFTGAGLAHLKDLPKLEKLTFAGSTAGDAALEAVGQLKQLKEFSTWHTAQTQAGNAHLLNLPELKSLRIGQRLPMRGAPTPASFDDSTLPTLAKITSLETLHLFEARLSFAALEQLKALPKLKTLRITQSDVSPEDIEKLRAALPDVKLDFQPMDAKERDELLVKKLKLSLAP
jgi:hypothetical protein